MAELFAYAHTLGERAAPNPRDDIITALTQPRSRATCSPSSRSTSSSCCSTVAGNETTRNLTATGCSRCSSTPTSWRSCTPTRRCSTPRSRRCCAGRPVMHFRRTATADTELGGKAIEEGDKVVIWYIGANRDETYFDVAGRVRRRPDAERAHRVRRRRAALLPRRQPRPLEINKLFDEVLSRAARPRAGRRRRPPALQLHQRHQAHARDVPGHGAENRRLTTVLPSAGEDAGVDEGLPASVTPRTCATAKPASAPHRRWAGCRPGTGS